MVGFGWLRYKPSVLGTPTLSGPLQGMAWKSRVGILKNSGPFATRVAWRRVVLCSYGHDLSHSVSASGNCHICIFVIIWAYI